MTSLEIIKNALNPLADEVHHYTAPPGTKPPYIVWAEDGANHFQADDKNAETAYTGTIDLFTLDQDDPLRESIPEALNGTPAAWYLNSIQYEEETDLIHTEWVWEV